MSQSNLLEIVRRPLSPDITLEVPASRLEYEQVQDILENEEQKYPRLLYDGVRNVAIIKAAPSALHGQMAESLVFHLSNAANSAIGAASISGRLEASSAETNTGDTGRGRTTREWDTALYFQEGRHATLMIAVEVAVSQSHTSLQRAISWSICALECRLGLTMAIAESRRRSAFGTRSFASLREAESTLAEYEADFESQLSSHPYGPLERDGVVWFGKVRGVLLHTYRRPEEDCPPDTVLAPCQEITLVADGAYVGHNVSENLRDMVLGDCVPTHLFQSRQIEQTPINFFRRDWFEDKFQSAMVRTALNRLWRTVVVLPS